MNKNKLSASKRIAIFFIDIFAFAFFFFVLSYGIFGPILQNTEKYKQSNETIKRVCVEYGLYTESANGKLSAIKFETSAEYESFFRDFYEKHLPNENIDEAFEKYKDYFSCKDGVCSAIKDEKKMVSFYENYFFNVASSAMYNDEDYKDASNFITRWSNIQTWSCIALPFVTLFFVVPLFSKYGKTIGMYIMKAGLVNSQTGYTAKKKQIILRNAILIVFEGLFSVFLYFVPLFISIGFLAFTKNNVALHDYFAVTMMVNCKDYNIYDSEEEYLEVIEKINAESSIK